MKKKAGSQFRTVFAHIVLILLSFMCLFFFYVLIINATRSHGDLQKGFSALPGKYFLENLKNVANDGSFPMFRGILNSVIVSSCSAALCTYFSSLTAYGLYAYEFKARKVAFTFIMAILVMPFATNFCFSCDVIWCTLIVNASLVAVSDLKISARRKASR